jgi:hypothetical protein
MPTLEERRVILHDEIMTELDLATYPPEAMAERLTAHLAVRLAGLLEKNDEQDARLDAIEKRLTAIEGAAVIHPQGTGAPAQAPPLPPTSSSPAPLPSDSVGVIGTEFDELPLTSGMASVERHSSLGGGAMDLGRSPATRIIG